MKEDLFVQKNPLQNTPGAGREDLFVQENPILNSPEKKRGEAPTPSLEWDFKGMGMPDNFSIARKTFWFQLLIYTTYTGFIVGGAVLLWVVVMMVMAVRSQLPTEDDLQYATPPPNSSNGATQEDKNCFVLEGHPDVVTAIAFSPDGIHMITGGGKMGVTTPSGIKDLSPRDPEDEDVNVLRQGMGKPTESAEGEDGPKMTHGLNLSEIRKEYDLPPLEEEEAVADPTRPPAPVESAPAKPAPAKPAPQDVDEEGSGEPDSVSGARESAREGNIPASRSVSHSLSRTVTDSADMDAVAEAAQEAEPTPELPKNVPGEKTDEAPDAPADAPAEDAENEENVETAENPEDTPEDQETGKTEAEQTGEAEEGEEEVGEEEEFEDMLPENLEPRDILDGTGSGDEIPEGVEDRDPLQEIFNPNKIRQRSTEQEVKDNMASASVEPPPGVRNVTKTRPVERPMDVLKLMGNSFRRLLVMKKFYEQEAKRRLEEKEVPSIFKELDDMTEIARQTDDLQPVAVEPAQTVKPPMGRPRDALELMANKFRRAMLIGNYMRSTGQPWPPKKMFEVKDDGPRESPIQPVQALKYLAEVEPAPRYVANIQFRSYKKDESRRTVVEKPEENTDRREELDIDAKMLMSSSQSPDSSESLRKTAQLIQSAEAENTEAAEKSGTSWTNTSEIQAFPIVIWDLRTCRPVQIMWEHHFPITSISISRGGDQFVSTDLGGNAILWKLTKSEDGKKPASALPVVSLEAPEKSRGGASSEMKTVSYMRQGGELVSVTASGTEPASEAGKKPAVAASPAQPSSPAASAPARSRVPLWKMVGKITPNVREEKRLGRVIAYYGAAFAPSGKQFVLCGVSHAVDVTMNAYAEAGMLMLWDIESWSEVTRMHPVSHQPSTWFQTLNPVEVFRSVAFTPDGQYLLAGASGFNAGAYWFQASGEGQCMAVDIDQPRKDRQVFTANMTLESNLVSGTSGHESPEAEQLHIAVSPDGNRVVSGDEYGRVNFWYFSPVFSRQDRGVFRLATVDVRDAQTRHIRSIIYSKDKRFVMLVGEDSSFRNGSKRTFDYLGKLKIDSSGMFRQTMFDVVCAQYTPDKQYLALGCDDHKIRVWKMGDIPLTSPTVLSSDTQTAEGEQASYEQSVDSAKKVMTFSEDTTKVDERIEKYDPDKIESRLPSENLQDPMQSRNRALESHNPLDKRLPTSSEETLSFPL